MRLVRCDVCLREGPTDQNTPAPGWAHLTLARVVDAKQELARTAGRVIAEAQTAMESGDVGAALEQSMHVALAGALGPARLACLDVCPDCASQLSVTVGGATVASVHEVLREVRR